MKRLSRLVTFAAVALLAGSIASSAFAGDRASDRERKQRERPIVNPKFDPTATRVELFSAMKDETISVRMMAQNAYGGYLYIKNETDEAVTVEMPDAFVGIPVLKQIGGGFGGQQGGGFGGGQGGQQGGGQQNVGGGGQQQGGGLGGGQQGGAGGGGNFFSIPPERIVQYAYRSVCLEHGKTEPSPKIEYQVHPVETIVSDPVLHETIRMVAAGRLDKQSAQAAAWHLANGLSWQELASQRTRAVHGYHYHFSQADLLRAQLVVATATGHARERALAAKEAAENAEPETEQIPDRVQASANR